VRGIGDHFGLQALAEQADAIRMQTQPGPPQPPPPNYPPPGYPYGYPVAQRTNGLAIASLALGCAQVFFWGVGGLAAVITGHIALGQIKRDRTQTGRGMAIAGLILGYIGIALTVLFFLLIVGLFAAAPKVINAIDQSVAREQASTFARDVQISAQAKHVSPRTPSIIRDAAAAPQFGPHAVIHLPNGTPVAIATTRDFARAGWRVEMTNADGLSAHPECITISASADVTPAVVDGPCS
jgi:hypothetical protein